MRDLKGKESVNTRSCPLQIGPFLERPRSEPRSSRGRELGEGPRGSTGRWGETEGLRGTGGPGDTSRKGRQETVTVGETDSMPTSLQVHSGTTDDPSVSKRIRPGPV